MKSGRLYALQFSDGTVKVGVTSSIVSRWRSLIWASGKRVVRAFCTPPIEDVYFRAEGLVLERMRALFEQDKAAEWFRCWNFGAVTTLVRQVYRKYGADRCGWRNIDLRIISPWQTLSLKRTRLQSDGCVLRILRYGRTKEIDAIGLEKWALAQLAEQTKPEWFNKEK